MNLPLGVVMSAVMHDEFGDLNSVRIQLRQIAYLENLVGRRILDAGCPSSSEPVNRGTESRDLEQGILAKKRLWTRVSFLLMLISLVFCGYIHLGGDFWSTVFTEERRSVSEQVSVGYQSSEKNGNTEHSSVSELLMPVTYNDSLPYQDIGSQPFVRVNDTVEAPGCWRVVKPGDTLSQIATEYYGRKHTFLWSKIATVNGMSTKQADHIYPGMLLWFPTINDISDQPITSLHAPPSIMQAPVCSDTR